MEHIILWAICSLMVLIMMFGIQAMDVADGRIEPEENTSERHLPDLSTAGAKGLFMSMLDGLAPWVVFELVYWVFT